MVVQGGCFPCNAPRACTLHQSGALQQVTFVVSRYDGIKHNIRKHLTCKTPNIVYYILCPCINPADYVGSSKNMKPRWSQHKKDIRNSHWTACGLTRHFGQCHRQDLEVHISRLEVTLLDSCEDEKDLKRLEDKWMCNMGTLFLGGGLNSRNEVINNRRRNYGGS